MSDAASIGGIGSGGELQLRKLMELFTHWASTVQIPSKDVLLSLMAFSQKQQGSKSATIRESKLFSNMGTDVKKQPVL